jgi:pyruvate dehydrogenase E1 component beta subunit
MSGGQTNVPMVLRTMTGTGFGTGGQHCDYLEAWFAHTPGLKVVCPSTPNDAYGLMLSALEDEDPVIWVENMPIYWTPGPVEFEKIPLGKARIAQAGADVTIIAHSRMVLESLAAAATLAEKDISAEVIDLRTVAPWDRETVLASVEKTRRAVVVHEAVREFGIGGELASEISDALFHKLRSPVKRLGAPYAPVPFSKPLESAYAPNAEGIVAAVIGIMAD